MSIPGETEGSREVAAEVSGSDVNQSQGQGRARGKFGRVGGEIGARGEEGGGDRGVVRREEVGWMGGVCGLFWMRIVGSWGRCV